MDKSKSKAGSVKPPNQVECIVKTKEKEILLIETEKPATTQRLGLTVRCTPELMKGIVDEIAQQLQGCVLDSKTKLKPAEITTLEVTLDNYETEEMLFEKQLRGKLAPEREHFTYEATRQLGVLLQLQQKQFCDYLFGQLSRLLKLEAVQVLEHHSVIQISAQISDDKLQQFRKDLLRLLRSVFAFGYVFDNEVLLNHFVGLLEHDTKLAREASFCRDPDLKTKLYVYTRSQELARELLQHVCSLTQRTISLRLIFQTHAVRNAFLKNELEPLAASCRGLLLTLKSEDQLEAVGELHRLMEFETQLHNLYVSFKTMKFEWECNPLSLELLQQRRAEFQERNNKIELKDRERRVYLHFLEPSRQAIGIELTLISRSTAELNNEYRRLLNNLSTIKQDIVKVGRTLSEFLSEQNYGRTTLLKIEQKFKVCLQLDNEYLLIVGSEENIGKVKKHLSQQSDEQGGIDLQTKDSSHPQQQQEVFELPLSQRQYELLQKDQLWKQLDVADERQSKGVFMVSLRREHHKDQVEVKIELLQFLLRTKDKPWLDLPKNWSQDAINRTVKIGYPTGEEAAYLHTYLNLQKDGYIMQVHRIENQDRHCLFHRTNVNYRPAVLKTSLPLQVLLSCIQNNREIRLSKMVKGQLAWTFVEAFKPTGKHQTLMIALVAAECLDAPGKQCTASHKYLPQYVLDISSVPPNRDLYTI